MQVSAEFTIAFGIQANAGVLPDAWGNFPAQPSTGAGDEGVLLSWLVVQIVFLAAAQLQNCLSFCTKYVCSSSKRISTKMAKGGVGGGRHKDGTAAAR